MEFNDKFFEQMGRDDDVIALCEARGKAVLAEAKATAPVDDGDYRDGLQIKRVRRGRRDAILVVGTDWKTMLVESKTGNLARALKKAGRG